MFVEVVCEAGEDRAFTEEVVHDPSNVATYVMCRRVT
jgi:hypothetical protein